MTVSSQALHIESEIARAWSLPAPFYKDTSIFESEKEQIFARTWQVVGHRHQVASPGDFFTTELQGEPLLLVRVASSADSTMSAGIALALPPRVAVPASYFAVAIKDGLTASTES